MYNVNVRHNGKLRVRRPMRALPALGHILRFGPKDYGRVTDVCWCLDEPSTEGYRVNITTQRLDSDGKEFALVTLVRRCLQRVGGIFGL